MAAHGLTGCAQLYSIPDGAKYIAIVRQGDYRSNELLQLLKERVVQVVIDDDAANVFIWWPAFQEQEQAAQQQETGAGFTVTEAAQHGSGQ